MVVKIVDALGHTISLDPAPGGAPAPPPAYLLQDGSGRSISLQLGVDLSWIDGLDQRGLVRAPLISSAQDRTKAANNVITYGYDADGLLADVTFPVEPGATVPRTVHYRYESNKYPGLLTAIENGSGDRVQIDYDEDMTDADERLSPRIKVRTIIVPEGGRFDYAYQHAQTRTTVTVATGGVEDCNLAATYLQDADSTKRRFVSTTEVRVGRGFVPNGAGDIVPRPAGASALLINTVRYSADRRFNVVARTDALGRSLNYAYNAFNQVTRAIDTAGHATEYDYDVPVVPTSVDPRRFDLLSVRRENVLRTINLAGSVVEAPIVATVRATYARYDAVNSVVAADRGRFSTHRPTTSVDELGHVWTTTYDDAGSFLPLEGTTLQTPLGHTTVRVFTARGELASMRDPGGGQHTFAYNAQGRLRTYTDPNAGVLTLAYTAALGGLSAVTDACGGGTTFVRDSDGRVTSTIDPAGQTRDYAYDRNGRVRQITLHRPAVLSDPADPLSSPLTAAFANLPTAFSYSVLGKLTKVVGARGLGLVLSYDEGGRLTEWFHDAQPGSPVRYSHDAADRVVAIKDRAGDLTTFDYHIDGTVRTVQSPPWPGASGTVPGKRLVFAKYDYLGRLLQVQDSELGVTEFVRDCCVAGPATRFVARRMAGVVTERSAFRSGACVG